MKIHKNPDFCPANDKTCSVCARVDTVFSSAKYRLDSSFTLYCPCVKPTPTLPVTSTHVDFVDVREYTVSNFNYVLPPCPCGKATFSFDLIVPVVVCGLDYYSTQITAKGTICIPVCITIPVPYMDVNLIDLELTVQGKDLCAEFISCSHIVVSGCFCVWANVMKEEMLEIPIAGCCPCSYNTRPIKGYWPCGYDAPPANNASADESAYPPAPDYEP